jgi:hypothetical protein
LLTAVNLDHRTIGVGCAWGNLPVGGLDAIVPDQIDHTAPTLLHHIWQRMPGTAPAHITVVLPQVPCCASCGIIEDALPEEIKLHAAIPTPLDQFQAVDLAFDGSG